MGGSRELVTYTYDPRTGEPTDLDTTWATDTVLVANAAWNAQGQREAWQLGATAGPEVHRSWTFAASSQRLHRIKAGTTAGGIQITGIRYVHDAVGNITRIRDDKNETGGVDQIQCFEYDDLYRLTEAYTKGVTGYCNGTHDAVGDGAYNYLYEYNAIGRILKLRDRDDVGNHLIDWDYGNAAVNAGPHAAHNWDPTGAASVNYAYDENGNMTSRGGDTMTFDANNRLVDYDDGTTTTEFVYDADGNRILRLGTDDTTYIGGIYETNGTVETAYYTFAGETVAMRTKDTASDKRYWLITDRLGSTINTVDATNTSNVSTHLYYPFGQERGTTAGSGTDRMYTGQVSDAADTGLLFYNARYYDPALRLFTAADTIIPDPANPQTFNRYAYVNNNPIRFADPSGHETCDLETGVCWSDTDYSAQSRLTQQCRCNVTTNMYGTYWSNIPVGDDGFPLRNGIPDGVIIQPPNGDGAGHRAYDHSDLAKGSMSWLPEMILTLVAGEALALLTGQIARPFVTRLVTRSIQRSASNATRTTSAVDDVGLSNRGLVPAAGTRVRPAGVPDEWRIVPTRGDGGVRYYDPTNPGNSVRVMQGNPNSPFPNSQAPYVRGSTMANRLM